MTKRQKNMEKMEKIAGKRKHELKKRATLYEEMFAELLKKYFIPCTFQKIVYTPTHYFILDFVTKTKPRIIFEIDGSSHYGRSSYDKWREEQVLKQKGYKHFRFVRITNDQVVNGEVIDILKVCYPKRFRYC